MMWINNQPDAEKMMWINNQPNAEKMMIYTRNSQCYTGLFYSAVHHRRCRLCCVLLMMGMMMPETCWDTNKYIIFSASGWLFIHLHDSRCTVTWN
jgi:hypothetical protein